MMFVCIILAAQLGLFSIGVVQLTTPGGLGYGVFNIVTNVIFGFFSVRFLLNEVKGL